MARRGPRADGGGDERDRGVAAREGVEPGPLGDVQERPDGGGDGAAAHDARLVGGREPRARGRDEEVADEEA